jgi:hypothetical protein
MKTVPIAEEHVPVVRRALAASDEPDLREAGQRGDIDYLVEDSITEASVTVWDALIAAELAGMRRLDAVESMQKLRDAIQPYVGKRLLRTGMWFSSRTYQIYVDPVAETVVHFGYTESPNPSGTENDRMPLRWPHTVLRDRESEPYTWIASNLFPAELLEPVAFEAAEVLYRCELAIPLLEFVVFGRPQPAKFSQADLNAAIMEACHAGGYELAAYWWSVNVHDNVLRVVERVGTYSFRDPWSRCSSNWPTTRLRRVVCPTPGCWITGIGGRCRSRAATRS